MINPRYQSISYRQIAIISMIILILSNAQIWAEEHSLPTDGISHITIKSGNSNLKILPWYEANVAIRASAENPDNAIVNISKMERPRFWKASSPGGANHSRPTWCWARTANSAGSFRPEASDRRRAKDAGRTQMSGLTETLVT